MPKPGAPRNIRELFHWVWQQLKDIDARIGDGDGGGSIPPHTHSHNALTDVSPNQHHSQQHDFLGSDHLNIPYLMPEAPTDGQTYGRDGFDVLWNPVYTKLEADNRFLPIAGADYVGYEGDTIMGGRF